MVHDTLLNRVTSSVPRVERGGVGEGGGRIERTKHK